MTQRVTDEQLIRWTRSNDSALNDVSADCQDARAEITSLRAKLDAVCEAGETLASEVLDICEDPFCDGPRCLACVAMKAAIAAARETKP